MTVSATTASRQLEFQAASEEPVHDRHNEHHLTPRDKAAPSAVGVES